MPCEVYAGTWNCAIVDACDWIALEDSSEEIADCPKAADNHHDIQEFAEATNWKDAMVKQEEGEFVHAICKDVKYDREVEELAGHCR